jgi:uncharacterized glyoxalase superfamily protein PhnB
MSQTSAPTVTDLMPTFRYRDCEAAIRWMVDVLGCEEAMVNRGPDGAVLHAELAYGTGMLMIGPFPDQVGGGIPEMDLGGTNTYLINDDDAVVEATWERATAAGAKVVDAFSHKPYGGSSFTVEGPEGHYWSVGSYRPKRPA